MRLHVINYAYDQDPGTHRGAHWPTLAVASQGCGFCRSYAVVVQIGEDAIGRRERLVQLAGRYASRLADDLRQLARELAVSLPDRVVAQVGEIGAERRELGDGIAAVDLRARSGAPAAGNDAGTELDLKVGVDDLLAGPHIFGAADIALDDVDELAVEVAVVDRGQQRQGGDEHREIGDDRSPNADFAFAVGLRFRHGGWPPKPQRLSHLRSRPLEPQGGAEAVTDGRPVLFRQGPRVLGDGDLGHPEYWARPLEQELCQLCRRALLGDRHRRAEAATLGDCGDVRAACSEAALTPRLAELLVVQHEDCEVLWCLVADHGQRPQPHHHFAVAGDGHDAAGGLGQRQAQRSRHREPHAAPGVEVFGAVAGGEAVPGRAAEPSDDQCIATVPEQLGDKRPARNLVGPVGHFCPNPLAPTMRWLTSTAALVRLLNARSAAAANVSPTSSALSTGKHLTPMASSVGLAAWPMGTCQGLNSRHWPRMVISIRQGAR